MTLTQVWLLFSPLIKVAIPRGVDHMETGFSKQALLPMKL